MFTRASGHSTGCVVMQPRVCVHGFQVSMRHASSNGEATARTFTFMDRIRHSCAFATATGTCAAFLRIFRKALLVRSELPSQRPVISALTRELKHVREQALKYQTKLKVPADYRPRLFDRVLSAPDHKTLATDEKELFVRSSSKPIDIPWATTSEQNRHR